MIYKLKTVHVVLKKSNDAVSKNVVKNANLDKLNKKVNNLEKKVPMRML